MQGNKETLTDKAAGEIERLRLTDGERKAIEQAIMTVDWHKSYFNGMKQSEPLPSAALRSLLERLK